jgi:hypothetical protein
MEPAWNLPSNGLHAGTMPLTLRGMQHSKSPISSPAAVSRPTNLSRVRSGVKGVPHPSTIREGAQVRTSLIHTR